MGKVCGSDGSYPDEMKTALVIPHALRYRLAVTSKRTNPEFLNGVPELVVLRLLAQRPMYGYQLVQSIKAASLGRLEFGEGCIYPILHRLQAQKDLTSKREAVDNRTRVVYHLTAQGKKRLASSVQIWQEAVAAVQAVLQGGLPDASIDLA